MKLTARYVQLSPSSLLMRIKIATLFIARALGAYAMARLITRKHVRILCYHGGAMADEAAYNPKLFCSAEHVGRRLQWLKRRKFDVVTLDEALDVLDAKAPPKRLPTVVTFDDGWFSTAHQLVPVLAQAGVPSTLYLTTEEYQRGWPVLSVAIRYAIWKSGRRHVAIDGSPAFDGDYDFGQAGHADRLVWRVRDWIMASATTRDEACACLRGFAETIGLPGDALMLDTRRFDTMTEDEMLELAAQGCRVELHGHAHYYPSGDPHAFQRNVLACGDIIRDAGLPEPVHYCYPGGAFDAGAGEVLARIGVRSATTCKPGLIDGKTPRFYLPRFLDGDSVHALEFEAEMSGLFHLVRTLSDWRRWTRGTDKRTRSSWGMDVDDPAILGTPGGLGNGADGWH
jgi:peptidoglycan/xylan/chitin deacetylase (PgdA/CDA1 family)